MAVATWGNEDPQAGGFAPGATSFDDIVSTQAGVKIGPPVPVGTMRRYRDTTGKYGTGEFIYLPGVSALAVGDVVTFVTSAGVSYTDAAVVRWAGTANTAAPLAVATSAITTTTQFGWFQVQGAAVVNTSGTVAASDKAFFSATATLQSTSVAGKQVLGAVASSANGVPITNQAIYTLDFPCVQSNIT